VEKERERKILFYKEIYIKREKIFKKGFSRKDFQGKLNGYCPRINL